MNEHKERITYYVGLHVPTGENDSASVGVRRALALDSFSDAYDAFTVADVLGVWQGEEEPSLRVEVITGHGRAAARLLAETLRDDLNQDAVAFTVEPVTFEII